MFRLVHAGVYLGTNLTSSWKPNIQVYLHYISLEGVVFTLYLSLCMQVYIFAQTQPQVENLIYHLIYIILSMKEFSLHLRLDLCMQVHIFAQT